MSFGDGRSGLDMAVVNSAEAVEETPEVDLGLAG